jgi:hypothetical protein
MRRSIPVAAAVFLAACGGGGAGGSDDPVGVIAVMPAPADLTPKTTRMTCTDGERKTPNWWAEVTIDPAEYPWRSMEVTSQYGPHFVSDPQGDIVNGRGIAAPLPPGSNAGSQPTFAQVFQEESGAILVWISSGPHLDLFKFRADGRMIELGQSPEASRPRTICTAAEPGQSPVQQESSP